MASFLLSYLRGDEMYLINNMKLDLSSINKNGCLYEWTSSIGKMCYFTGDGFSGYFKILDYDKHTHKLTVQYEDYYPYKIYTNDFIKLKFQKYLTQYHYNIDDVFLNNNLNLTILDRKIEHSIGANGYNITHEFYYCRCNICGYEFWIEYKDLKNKKNCSCCINRIVVPGVNDICTTDPWMIQYFQGGEKEAKLYTSGSSKEIYPICPDCGRIKDKKVKICKIHQRHTISCDCNDGISYPNKFSYAFIEQLPVSNYIKEYQPEWAKPYFYDNYFEYKNKKYIIEMDGGLGHGNRKFKSKEKDIEGLNRDLIKNKLAKQNNITIIRIDCIESDMLYIKNNILKSLLNEIFDLSNIDWLKCDEYAQHNIVKEVCLFYENNNHPKYNIIINKFGICKETITKYLDIGIRHGWCKSDEQIRFEQMVNLCKFYIDNNCPTQKEMIENFHVSTDTIRKYLKYGEEQGWLTINNKINFRKVIENNKKRLKIYDVNHNFVCEHIGLYDLINNSQKILNVKLVQCHLSKAIRNHTLYKGYYFEYDNSEDN